MIPNNTKNIFALGTIKIETKNQRHSFVLYKCPGNPFPHFPFTLYVLAFAFASPRSVKGHKQTLKRTHIGNILTEKGIRDSFSISFLISHHCSTKSRYRFTHTRSNRFFPFMYAHIMLFLLDLLFLICFPFADVIFFIYVMTGRLWCFWLGF